ncbi:MAG: DUF1343 domain-containing protein [Deltaproteobacteria bacterium]|nr:DUF1343 domain-containing protein [Deltaproteobacteria bacterium]
MARVVTGLERLLVDRRNLVAGRRVGLVAHPASTTSGLTHALDVLLEAGAEVEILFGPEHGFAGEAQDMEPVDGVRHGPRGLPLRSLYGCVESSLAPRGEDLAGLEALVVDLFDVGSRYYTFAWTAVLCLRACHAAGVRLVALDRPNPLGGAAVEGAPQEPSLCSFVGLLPVSNRHGLTLAELLALAARADGTADALEIVPMLGWRREMLFADTDLPWVMPSPNMPAFDTALVYPGQCLLEGTWASEGRGTTRPFEIFGAPGVDGVALAARLGRMGLRGARFRPLAFKPSFQKHTGELCGGVQIHVEDARAFLPYRTGVAALLALKAEAGDRFAWRVAPYEFVSGAPAVDLLAGTPLVREAVESGASIDEVAATWAAGERAFDEARREFFLYA